MTETAERRQQPRPTPRAPGWNRRLEIRIARLWRGIRAPVRDIVLLWVLTLGALLWTFWTIDIRLEPLHGWFDSVQNEIDLRDEVANYDRLWSADAVQQLHEQIDAAQRRILPGYSELSSWLYRQAEEARPDGVSISYLIGAAEPLTDTGELVAVPLLFSFKLDEAGAASQGYYKLLRRLAALLDAPWSMELRSASIDGANGHAQVMRLTLHMWMLRQQDTAAVALNQTDSDGVRMASTP